MKFPVTLQPILILSLALLVQEQLPLNGQDQDHYLSLSLNPAKSLLKPPFNTNTCPYLGTTMASNLGEEDISELLNKIQDNQEDFIKAKKDEFEKHQKYLLEATMNSVQTKLQSVVASMLKRQDTLEENSAKRITSLNKQLDSLMITLQRNQQCMVTEQPELLSSSICSPYSTVTRTSGSVREASLIPQVSAGPSSTTSTSSATTQDLTNQTIPSLVHCRDPELESASRTLGFGPILQEDLNCSQDPEQIMRCLKLFLIQKLSIPLPVVDIMSQNMMFKLLNKNTLYIEFSSQRDINTIFKFIKNLPRGCSVIRYIHPSLLSKHQVLSEKAYALRNGSPKYQTKILYSDNDLQLFLKMLDETIWYPALDSPTDSPSFSSPPESCPASPVLHQQNIPQIDGVNDDDATIEVLDRNSPSPQITMAPYYLNRDRQSARVAADASRDDMDITVNNNDSNVNIYCSTGFFIAVVQPSLSSIGEGSVSQFSSVQVLCTEFLHQKDQAGFSDFTRLGFTLKGQNGIVIGKVRVHARHTTRLVQVQGSARMSDKSTVAVWFAENFLTNSFRKLAKSKQYDITAYNQKILAMSQVHHQTIQSGKYCQHCSKVFSTRSKPSPCNTCGKHLHQMCMRPHLSSCRNSDLLVRPPVSVPLSAVSRRSGSCTSDIPLPTTSTVSSLSSSVVSSTASAPVPPNLSSPSSQLHNIPLQNVNIPTAPISLPGQFSPLSTPATSGSQAGSLSSLTTTLISSGIPTFTGGRTEVSFVPAITHLASSSTHAFTNSRSVVSFVPATTPLITSSTATVSSHTSISSIPAYTQAASQQLEGAMPTVPPTLNSQQERLQTSTSQRFPPRKKAKSKENTTPETIQIEYLTEELNYTHSKIVTQDGTIKDLEFKNKILRENLKIAEEKLNSDLHKKYFSTSSHTTSQYPSFCQHSRPQACCGAHSCFQHPQADPHAHNMLSTLNSEVSSLKSEIKDLKVMFTTLTSKINMQDQHQSGQYYEQTAAFSHGTGGQHPLPCHAPPGGDQLGQQCQQRHADARNLGGQNSLPCQIIDENTQAQLPGNTVTVTADVEQYSPLHDISTISIDESIQEQDLLAGPLPPSINNHSTNEHSGPIQLN